MSDLSDNLSKKSHDNSNNSKLNANDEYYTMFDYYTAPSPKNRIGFISKISSLAGKLKSSIYSNIHTIGLGALIGITTLSYFAEKELSKYKQFYGNIGSFESNIYQENTYDFGSISKGYGSLNKLTTISMFPDVKIIYIDGLNEISASEKIFYESRIEEVHIQIGSDTSKIKKYYASDINSTTTQGIELKTMFEVWNVEYNFKRKLLYIRENPAKKEQPSLHLVKL
jgi:hypothetical protein